MRHVVTLRWPWLLLAAAVALAFGAAWSISLALPLPSHDDFNVVRFELQHIPDKWLYLTGRSFGGKLSHAQEDERLGRYLELTLRIDVLPEGEPERRQLESERRTITGDVEAIIEGRVTAVLEDEGLESSLPLFPDARLVFPPVDVEYTDPPNELAVSPRDRIALIDERPLRPDLAAEDVARIEAQEERDGKHSALVDKLEGVATYPSSVAPEGDYRSLVELTAHEWVHHYLFFQPLGSRFYDSMQLRTLNETVATISGEEIAAAVVAKYPLPQDTVERLRALQPPPAPIDVGQALKTLRGEVDALLARGAVADAEALMEQRRQELAQQGAYFRRINQAFFAFANIYATSPASTDPLGEKVKQLRDRTQTVGPFLRAASMLTSASDLDRLLASSKGGTGR